MAIDKDQPRLIEVAFPLKQASLDSVHEKSVRHGHISTLHIWPARRPLAACRAALIATLLPDLGDDAERKRLLDRLAGRAVERTKRGRDANGHIAEKVKEKTEGGILHWGRESCPDLDWFRQEIRRAYGGRAPRVLDPFAGGGAIPLEAMRLGCEAVASDINPVAWFILKCTLEYPHRLAGQHRPLPRFALESREFMESYLKGQGRLTKKQLQERLEAVQLSMFAPPEADLAWHVRAWGHWVLEQARADLARFYPTYADFEPLVESPVRYEPRPICMVPVRADGALDLDALNAEFTATYLKDKRNPRWVPKPTVAYLWARTVECKACRATLPLLKTRWLCKKDNKRVLLTMQLNTDKTGVEFGIQNNVPRGSGSTAQRREHDKALGAGTMSRSGATCPCCGTIMTTEDIRYRGQAGQLRATMTAVVVDTNKGKEYRLPTPEERLLADEAGEYVAEVFGHIPFGLPDEPVPQGASRVGGGSPFTVHLYGLTRWCDLFTSRQLLALGTFVHHTRAARAALQEKGYSGEWVEAVGAELAIGVDKLADRQSELCRWDMGYSKINSSFTRFALPILWDFGEGNPLSDTTGNYVSCVEWVAEVIEHTLQAAIGSPAPEVHRESAIIGNPRTDFNLILSDPPYYDAIPYSDLMDFFYIWLRRILYGISPEIDVAFSESLSPKWDHASSDGELIDDASRFDGDKTLSKAAYEDGMFRAFRVCYQALASDGRLVIVFAHKQPDAWEALVAAIIRAGFVVDGSWPIQTEMPNRSRAHSSGALSSSIWLVCKKRPETARPGWDNLVLKEMREKITTRLRDFWDAGIRGPDFVWAATGPALEAYSRYPAVLMADTPGQRLDVSTFLRHVRRMVADFVVGRLLSPAGTSQVNELDDVTTYYLLHRQNFQYDEAPAGACILYAVSCNLSESDLVNQYDLLTYKGASAAVEEMDEEDEEDEEEDGDGGDPEPEDSGSRATLRLKKWHQRRGKNLGYEVGRGRPVPLIDRVHRLMHLWRAGDVAAVDEYVRSEALLANSLFAQLLQALIELEGNGNGDRALLESISNHLVGLGGRPPATQTRF